MWPNYLRRYEADLPATLDALADAVRAFDRELLAAAHAEREELLALIVPLLSSYCRDYDKPTQLPDGGSVVGGDGMPLAGKGIASVKVNVARNVALQCSVFRHIPASHDAVAPFIVDPYNHYEYSLKGHSTFCFQQPFMPQLAEHFERVARNRAKQLLAVYEVWNANGGKFVSPDWQEAAPVASAAPPPPSAPLAIAPSKAGAPALDLQNLKL